MAATLGNYFIDAPTLATATAVFDDAELSVCAADGFYSDGNVVRQQFNCVLLANTTCPSCEAECTSNISEGGGSGIYNLSVNLGSALGAIIIYFNPKSVPDGIRAIFNGTTYNEVTSPNFGYLASQTSGNYVVLGNSGNDCSPSIASTLAGGGYNNLDEYEYNSVTSSFDQTGTGVGVVTGVATDVNLTASAPGFCTMVVPRPTNVSSTALIQIVGFCGTAWDVELNCPVALTATPISVAGSNCVNVFPDNVFVAPNRGGTAGEPAVFEFAFTDGDATTKYPAGVYTINPPSGKKDITIDANGVITLITNCP